MHITQPAFSRIIASVEAELGFVVFERNRRNVQLTPAGQDFVAAIEKSLQIYKAGVEQGLSNGVAEKQDPLVIGYIPDGLNSDLRDILAMFRKGHPEVEIRLDETSYYEMQEALLNRDLDAAIYTSNLSGLPEKLAVQKLESYELYVAVFKEHPYANRESIHSTELVNESFVELCYNKVFSKSWNALQYVGKTAGFVPIIAHQVSTLSSFMLQVSVGQGIAIVTKPMMHFFGELYQDDIKFLLLEDIEPFGRVIMWSKENENNNLPFFISEVADCYQAPGILHYWP